MASPRTTTELPFHLRGNYAPVMTEVTETDLPITGALPPELCGTYLRNGPNPKSGTSPHWFAGDGMIHGVRLDQGRAAWYRNRWLRTRSLTEPGAQMIGDDGTVDRTIGVSNTHVVRHAGRVMALVESSFPCELTPELDTVGPYDYGGRLTSAMTAHPKICPLTGELHFFGYHWSEPYLTYHRANAEGDLVQSEVIDVPGPTMVHDFSITETQVVFLDLPVVFDLELALQGTMPYRWDDDYGARIGVMPRGVAGAQPRWFEVEPCYVFHPLNSYDDGGVVVLDAARYPELWRRDPSRFANDATLHRWRLDTAAGTVTETALDDRSIEFPRLAEHLVGRRNRFGYAVGSFDERNALVKYDLDRQASSEHDFGPDRVPGEAVFVAAADGRNEDDGWLLAFVYDKGRHSSDLVVLDASEPEASPVATITLPQRVPFGFHGSWLPGAG